jgi:hypothetical protein
MKDKENKRLWITLLGLTVAFSVYASNPALTDYVDAKIATLQAEINQILQGGSG